MEMLMTSRLLAALFLSLPLLFAALPYGTARANTTDDQSDKARLAERAEKAKQQAAKRDALFKKLKSAPNEQQARMVEMQIWEHWLRDTDITSRTLVMDAMDTRGTMHFDHAMDLLNTAIKRTPDYAEAWNQRAYLYFLINDYKAALSDIDKALELEPKHFGALAGKARIYMRQGRIRAMEDTLKQAIEIHPWLKERHLLNKEKYGEPL